MKSLPCLVQKLLPRLKLQIDKEMTQATPPNFQSLGCKNQIVNIVAGKCILQLLYQKAEEEMILSEGTEVLISRA